MPENEVDYEHLPAGQQMDEVDVSLRAHFANMSDEKLSEYKATWSDEEIVEWEPDFRNDGNLMMICVERDVDVVEYRQVIEEHIAFRRDNGATI